MYSFFKSLFQMVSWVGPRTYSGGDVGGRALPLDSLKAMVFKATPGVPQRGSNGSQSANQRNTSGSPPRIFVEPALGSPLDPQEPLGPRRTKEKPGDNSGEAQEGTTRAQEDPRRARESPRKAQESVGRAQEERKKNPGIIQRMPGRTPKSPGAVWFLQTVEINDLHFSFTSC